MRLTNGVSGSGGSCISPPRSRLWPNVLDGAQPDHRRADHVEVTGIAVPFLDLAAGYDELREELDAAALRVLHSGWFVLGPEVEAFEREWASYCGTADAIGVGNGLDALTLILRAYGIGPGDEVIVPSNT